MKVLHVIQTIAVRFGGPAVLLRALVHHQKDAGDDVTICTTNTDYPTGVLPVPSDRPVLNNGVAIWYHQVQFKPFVFSLPFKIWIDTHIKDFDIVHIHGLYRFPVTYAAWAARKANVPYIISPRGSLDPFLYRQSRYSISLKRLYEKVFDFPNLNGASIIHYTAINELKRANYLNLTAPTAVVPNGIDWSQYVKLPRKGVFRDRIKIDGSTPLVLFLGRINFKKGLDLLVPAFSLVAEQMPNSHLAVVGPDNEGLGADVNKWCNENGIACHVSVVDHLNPDQVCQAYVDADVFVLPSYTENFGMAVVEAMACRCPVVISNQVNIWPAVEQAGAGKVVRLRIQEIAGAILSVLNNRELADRMGGAGRKLARRYAYDQIAGRMRQMYEHASDKGKQKRIDGVRHPKNIDDRIQREKRAHDEKDILSENHKLKAKFPHVLTYPSRNRLFESIDRIMTDIDGKTILDYGCGSGNHCMEYLERGATCHGIDISETYIASANKAAQIRGFSEDRYSFKVMDAHRLEFEDRQFDIVIGLGILHHLEPSIAMAEIHRVLKPGGRVLLQEPLADNWLLKLFRRLTPYARTKDERPFTKNDIDTFTSQYRWKSEISVCGLIEAPLAMLTSFAMPCKPDNVFMNLADKLESFTHRHKVLLSWNQYVLLNFIKEK